MSADSAGRRNQRRRTRKDLLDAAARLAKRGEQPSLEQVAEEALVSRATAYRYFPSVEALMLEASLDVAAPTPAELFAGDGSRDPIARLRKADAALQDMIVANEAALRLMLAQSLQRTATGAAEPGLPARQNRRAPLIEAALEPARAEFSAEAHDTLTKALALIFGTEAAITCKDVLQLDEAEARRVKSWAIAALVAAARAPSTTETSS